MDDLRHQIAAVLPKPCPACLPNGLDEVMAIVERAIEAAVDAEHRRTLFTATQKAATE